MATIRQRLNKWIAVYRVNGKQISKSTNVNVTEAGHTPKELRRLALETAEKMELSARGVSPVDKAVDAVRASGEALGLGRKMPSVREFLEAFPRTGKIATEQNRKRSFDVFLEFLGARADARLDSIKVEDCEQFCRWAVNRWGKNTVGVHRANISAVFNYAIEVKELMYRNPMKAVKFNKIAEQVERRLGVTRNKREPFSIAEIRYIIENFPHPWNAMVAVSWFGGGLRLSDVSLLRWSAIDLQDGVIRIVEQKTGAKREIVIIPQMKAVLEQLSAMNEDGKYVFPRQAQLFLRSNSSGNNSAEFTSLLRAYGIVKPKSKKMVGERRELSPKSFHSIRHAFVTWGRTESGESADVVRAVVGHEDDDVEQGYIHTSRDKASSLLLAGAKAVEEAPIIMKPIAKFA